jgi:hypothetical protein
MSNRLDTPDKQLEWLQLVVERGPAIRAIWDDLDSGKLLPVDQWPPWVWKHVKKVTFPKKHTGRPLGVRFKPLF